MKSHDLYLDPRTPIDIFPEWDEPIWDKEPMGVLVSAETYPALRESRRKHLTEPPSTHHTNAQSEK